jgi:hypothetical protein
MRIRRIISAPARFLRYIREPGRKAVAQREAMSPAKKQAWRANSLKRNGLFLVFAKTDKPRKKRDP